MRCSAARLENNSPGVVAVKAFSLNLFQSWPRFPKDRRGQQWAGKMDSTNPPDELEHGAQRAQCVNC